MYKILLMGPQGSGKGTQAQLLSEKLGIPAYSMGQLLREEIQTASLLGKKIEHILHEGNLVSDEDAAAVLQARIHRDDAMETGYIIDGYPRNRSQKASYFDTPTHVFVIRISENESLLRLSGRLTCSATGKIYSSSDGFKEGESCPSGGILFFRDDDQPDAIKKRLAIYQKDTQPVIEDYQRQGMVHFIDGMDTVADVAYRIQHTLTNDYGTH